MLPLARRVKKIEKQAAKRFRKRKGHPVADIYPVSPGDPSQIAMYFDLLPKCSTTSGGG
jgi:hypothetical protein